MKKSLSFWGISTPLFFLIAFSGCKKSENNLKKQIPVNENTISKLSPKTIELLNERMKREGRSFTVQLNKKLETYYSDKNGMRISPMNQRTIISACTGFTDAYSTLLEYKQSFDCTYGYKLSWKYQISTDNNIVGQNPVFTSQKSKGIIRIFNVGDGTPAYQQMPENVTITDMGADPFYGSGYESFIVEIESDYISDIYINNAMAYSLKMGAQLAIDCTNGTAPVGITITDYGFPNYGSGLPCDRNDKVWIIPGGGIASVGFAVFGVDPIYDCPTGYNYPTAQKVEYSVNGGGWQNISNAISSSPLSGKTYLTPFDFAFPPLLPSGTYSYTFRYKNVDGHFNENQELVIECGGDDDPNKTYTYETWSITY